jgi:excisionase family DNA binding protein
MPSSNLTVGQVSQSLGLPPWKIRRLVDSLEVPIERFGRNRLIPAALIGTIAVEAERRGWFLKPEPAK